MNEFPIFDLLIVTVLGIATVVIAFEAILVVKASGRQGRNKVFILALLMGGIFLLYDKLGRPEHSYNDYLSGEVGRSFALIVAALSLSVFCALELTHLVRGRNWKTLQSARVYWFAVCFALGVTGSYLMLQNTASTLADLMTGPIHKSGSIQEKRLWTGTTAVFGGFVTVDDTVYRLPNVGWFDSVSVGQNIQFLCGPRTHYAFPPNETAFTQLGLIPLASIGCGTLILTLWALRLTSRVPKPSIEVHDVR